MTAASANGASLPPLSAPAAGASPTGIAAIALAGVVDTALIALLARGSIGIAPFLTGHLAVVALLALVALRRRPGADLTLPALAALSVLATGPAGALGAIVCHLLAPGRIRDKASVTPLLTAWYARIANSVEIDPVTQLCDTVSIGRAVDLGSAPIDSFAAVMEHGNLADRQALLGLVARSFDIEYLPALKIALKSAEPVIRVQAAAVATRVQLAIRRVVRTWAEARATGISAIDALAATKELEACLASGLVEEGDRAEAAALLADMRRRALAAIAARGFATHLLTARAHPRQMQAQSAYEALLLRDRRFAELRRWRQLKPAGLQSRYRLRFRTRGRPRPTTHLQGAAQ